ncbi:tripartite tricarboxylate transporter substrate binding protein [Ammoniphilus resinae]|uniref:Tripartite-type tricarboxylate transporter receptor subunit TctC n=1 Tax=Ammoniphilus resinae TaxID=861532 RepID=A0ABS4GLB3_9BACL|nr:tripartite tricarboxylate transporter substrate binding protein [Ammoniphilus resinae]MBP1931024.1 tripartite-type tricarboxylate transporter receptor subunit TctC [Ammoniphilus resinae]
MKKWFSTVLTLMLLIPLIACGGQPSTTQTSNTPPTPEKQQPAEQKTDETKPSEEKKPGFPEKSMSFIVPYAAGGGTDLITRSLAKAAEPIMGQSIAVMNKPGGGGAVGMTEGSLAKPDGYTVTMITVESTILPHLGLAQFSYEDFVPIAQVSFDPSVVTVAADSPFETITDFLNYAKENPGKVKVGNGGAGGIWHLAAASIEQAAGVKFNHVPFDGGNPAVTALLGGHIDAVTVSAGEVLEQVKAGKLKPLAVLSDEHISAFPDLPTFKESGIEATPLGSWKGIAVPKNTPDDAVKFLSDAFLKAAESDEFKDFMEAGGLERVVKDAEKFSEKLKSDDAYFNKLVQDLGLKK